MDRDDAGFQCLVVGGMHVILLLFCRYRLKTFLLGFVFFFLLLGVNESFCRYCAVAGGTIGVEFSLSFCYYSVLLLCI